MLARVDVRFTREGILRTVCRQQAQRRPVTVLSIVEAVDCSENTVRSHIKALILSNYIEQVPGTGRGKSRAQYRIRDEGQQALRLVTV